MIGDQEVITGQQAKKITRTIPDEPTEGRMDGKFLTVSVESGRVRDGVRMRVRNIENDEELTVKVPKGTLTPEQIQTLQDGEWNKKPLFMQLNVRKSGNRIIEATLIEAGLK